VYAKDPGIAVVVMSVRTCI